MSTHNVRRGPAQGFEKYEEIPCDCAATMDHSIGNEQKPKSLEWLEDRAPDAAAEATPTPQAQAGEAVVADALQRAAKDLAALDALDALNGYGTYQVHVAEIDGDDDALVVKADDYERLLQAYEALVKPPPATISRDAGAVDAERVAQLIAHRACCGTEHDPANGKLHGYCVVCGVDWPCEYAGKPPRPGDTHPAAASEDARRLAELERANATLCRWKGLLTEELILARHEGKLPAGEFPPDYDESERWALDQYRQVVQNELLADYASWIATIPEGAFDVSKGDSTYNWHRAALQKLRELAALTPPDGRAPPTPDTAL